MCCAMMLPQLLGDKNFSSPLYTLGGPQLYMPSVTEPKCRHVAQDCTMVIAKIGARQKETNLRI